MNLSPGGGEASSSSSAAGLKKLEACLRLLDCSETFEFINKLPALRLGEMKNENFPKGFTITTAILEVLKLAKDNKIIGGGLEKIKISIADCSSLEFLFIKNKINFSIQEYLENLLETFGTSFALDASYFDKIFGLFYEINSLKVKQGTLKNPSVYTIEKHKHRIFQKSDYFVFDGEYEEQYVKEYVSRRILEDSCKLNRDIISDSMKLEAITKIQQQNQSRMSIRRNVSFILDLKIPKKWQVKNQQSIKLEQLLIDGEGLCFNGAETILITTFEFIKIKKSLLISISKAKDEETFPNVLIPALLNVSDIYKSQNISPKKIHYILKGFLQLPVNKDDEENYFVTKIDRKINKFFTQNKNFYKLGKNNITIYTETILLYELEGEDGQFLFNENVEMINNSKYNAVDAMTFDDAYLEEEYIKNIYYDEYFDNFYKPRSLKIFERNFNSFPVLKLILQLKRHENQSQFFMSKLERGQLEVGDAFKFVNDIWSAQVTYHSSMAIVINKRLKQVGDPALYEKENKETSIKSTTIIENLTLPDQKYFEVDKIINPKYFTKGTYMLNKVNAFIKSEKMAYILSKYREIYYNCKLFGFYDYKFSLRDKLNYLPSPNKVSHTDFELSLEEYKMIEIINTPNTPLQFSIRPLERIRKGDLVHVFIGGSFMMKKLHGQNNINWPRKEFPNTYICTSFINYICHEGGKGGSNIVLDQNGCLIATKNIPISSFLQIDLKTCHGGADPVKYPNAPFKCLCHKNGCNFIQKSFTVNEFFWKNRGNIVPVQNKKQRNYILEDIVYPLEYCKYPVISLKKFFTDSSKLTNDVLNQNKILLKYDGSSSFNIQVAVEDLKNLLDVDRYIDAQTCDAFLYLLKRKMTSRGQNFSMIQSSALQEYMNVGQNILEILPLFTDVDLYNNTFTVLVTVYSLHIIGVVLNSKDKIIFIIDSLPTKTLDTFDLILKMLNEYQLDVIAANNPPMTLIKNWKQMNLIEGLDIQDGNSDCGVNVLYTVMNLINGNYNFYSPFNTSIERRNWAAYSILSCHPIEMMDIEPDMCIYNKNRATYKYPNKIEHDLEHPIIGKSTHTDPTTLVFKTTKEVGIFYHKQSKRVHDPLIDTVATIPFSSVEEEKEAENIILDKIQKNLEKDEKEVFIKNKITFNRDEAVTQLQVQEKLPVHLKTTEATRGKTSPKKASSPYKRKITAIMGTYPMKKDMIEDLKSLRNVVLKFEKEYPPFPKKLYMEIPILKIALAVCICKEELKDKKVWIRILFFSDKNLILSWTANEEKRTKIELEASKMTNLCINQILRDEEWKLFLSTFFRN